MRAKCKIAFCALFVCATVSFPLFSQPTPIASQPNEATSMLCFIILIPIPFWLPNDDDDDKQLSERERRLKSLAKSVEKEERPATPSFGDKKRAGNSITFDDIKFDMEKGDRFKRTMLTDSINELAGERIKLKGYIRPSIKQKGLTKFIFVRDDKECCFGPGAALFDCVLVTLAKGKKSDFTVRPITVEGDFYLKEFKGPDGKIWAIYRMKNCEVKR